MEQGIAYHFDASRVMFCSGNGTEKARMASLEAQGETIVDLFAGIGYFTLPLLVHARARHVHAVEWNPDAVACLRINLARADVAVRATVWPGDNAYMVETPVAGTADRVLLGLIPSSKMAWPTALRMLKRSGGMLHVHENCSQDGVLEWAQAELLPALDDAKPHADWKFRLMHTERVKNYSPRVLHCVFDVQVYL
jgi:hypothetical protein